MSGTRRILHATPWSPRIFQNARLFRWFLTVGLLNGMIQLPTLRVRGGPCTSELDSMGLYVRRSRFKKSKMLCREGSTPVMNDAHATGDIAGYVVWSRVKEPSAASLEKFGSSPAAIHCSSKLGSSPSRPRKITLFTRDRCFSFRRRMRLMTNRTGHTTTVSKAEPKAISNAKNDPRNANPAPGPMYASDRPGNNKNKEPTTRIRLRLNIDVLSIINN